MHNDMQSYSHRPICIYAKDVNEARTLKAEVRIAEVEALICPQGQEPRIREARTSKADRRPITVGLSIAQPRPSSSNPGQCQNP